MHTLVNSNWRRESVVANENASFCEVEMPVSEGISLSRRTDTRGSAKDRGIAGLTSVIQKRSHEQEVVDRPIDSELSPQNQRRA